MKYTVLLLYPDYIADPYGQETYFKWVEAASQTQAVKDTQNSLGKLHETCPDDFYPLLVIEGHHADLRTGDMK